MSNKQTFLLCLFFSVLALPYSLWFASSVDQPLWTDEIVTAAEVQSVTLKHMFSAVLLGLDPTPPLYTGYGWFMLHYVFSGASPELLLRITNAGLIAATLWILYLLVRRFFDRMTALTTIAIFILLELSQLKFLTLEMRAYAALVFSTSLAIYTALSAIARPSWISLTCTMLACWLLVSTHIFGVIYVVSIVICMIVAATAEGNIRLALYSGLTGVPAVIGFFSWVPVMHATAQLGSWIESPDFHDLLVSTYPPANKLRLLAALLLITVLALLWRHTQRHKGTMPIEWWQSTSCGQRFVVMLPITFGVSTLSVWLFSNVVFPVFVQRYFFPNIILHTMWISGLVDVVYSYLASSKAKYGLTLATAVLAGACIKYYQSGPDNRIPCFDPYRRAYLEDRFKDDGVIVTLWSHSWLTRINRTGEVIAYPIEESALKNNGTLYPSYVYNYGFVPLICEMVWCKICDEYLTVAQYKTWFYGPRRWRWAVA